MMVIFLFLIILGRADVLSEYVEGPEESFSWFEEEDLKFKTTRGNTAHVLNVTSLKWMDESRAYGPRGAIWDHTVIVVVPKHLKHTNVSTVYLTWGCNENPTPKHNDLDMIIIDEWAS